MKYNNPTKIVVQVVESKEHKTHHNYSNDDVLWWQLDVGLVPARRSGDWCNGQLVQPSESRDIRIVNNEVIITNAIGFYFLTVLPNKR